MGAAVEREVCSKRKWGLGGPEQAVLRLGAMSNYIFWQRQEWQGYNGIRWTQNPSWAIDVMLFSFQHRQLWCGKFDFIKNVWHSMNGFHTSVQEDGYRRIVLCFIKIKPIENFIICKLDLSKPDFFFLISPQWRDKLQLRQSSRCLLAFPLSYVKIEKN